MSFPLASNTPNPAFGFGSEKALHAPFGAVSPLWMAYAGVAGAGVAYWWMTRWMRPFNIEAASASAPLLKIAAPVAEAVVVVEVEPEPEPVAETPAPESVLAAEPVVEDLIETEPTPTVVVAETEPAPDVVKPGAKTRKASAKAKSRSDD